VPVVVPVVPIVVGEPEAGPDVVPLCVLGAGCCVVAGGCVPVVWATALNEAALQSKTAVPNVIVAFLNMDASSLGNPMTTEQPSK
jgi:hypothetical protein